MEKEKLMVVSASPHMHTGTTTRGIMLDVIIALCPSLIASVVIFGLRALAVSLVSVAACVFFEWAFRKYVLKIHCTIGDLSAVVTGLLLAFNLPSSISYWMVIIGAAFAIIIIKQCFGGIGQNFINPALGGRIVMLLSFAGAMSSWTQPLAGIMNLTGGTVALTGATPLAAVKEELPSLFEMFLGIRGGCLGETSALAILLGLVYLLIRKVIKLHIPLAFIGTVFVGALLFGKGDIQFAVYQLMSGGLLLGAVFMATDYSTSPICTKGKIIFGIGCGIITCLIRFFGSLPEGVSYSILLMNILTPLIEKATTPKPFGTPKKEKKSKEAQV